MLAWRRAAGQTAKALLGLFVGLTVLLLVAAGVLLWRAGQGPVNVTWLARRVLPEVEAGATIGHATLAIQGAGGERMVVVTADNLADPARQLTLRSARLSIPFAPLLTGRVTVTDATIEGVRATVQVPQQGQQQSPGGGRRAPERLLAHLDHLHVADARVTLTGGPADGTVTLQSADLTRGADGVLQGKLAADLASGAAAVHLDASGSDGPGGATITASIPALDPAALAGAVPALAPAAALDATFALHGQARFGPDFAFQSASLHAEAGAGTVFLPAKGGGTSPGHFAAVSLDAAATPSHLDVSALRLVVQPPSGNPPSTVVAGIRADRAGGRFTAHVTLDLDRLALADLGSVWPERVGGGSRPWLAENLTGLAHDGHFAFTLTGKEDGADIDIPDAGGTVTGDDVTIWWLRPVPPVQHAHAVLTWQNPDVMLIAVTGARQGAIAAKTGQMRITGLTTHDQVGFIDADLQGPLSDVITLLKNPRLKLLSRRPIAFTDPSGAVTAHLSVRLPLEAHVQIEQVAIHASGAVANAHLGNAAADRAIDAGQFSFDVDNDGLTISGPAEFDRIPAKLDVRMDFRDGPPSQVLEHVTAALHLTAPDAERAGLGALGLTGGALPASIDYEERRDGTASIGLHADLGPARFETPVGWSKAAGAAGQATVQVSLDHGHLSAIERAQAEAPGLRILGRGDVAGGRVTAVHIERGEIGRTALTGTITLPAREGEPYRVRLAGPQLDLQEPLRAARERPASTQREQRAEGGTAYDVSVRFGRVLLGPGRDIGSVELDARGNGRRLAEARLVTGGPERMRADLVAVPAGRRLSASAADLGALLRATGLASEIVGGSMQLDGTFEDRQPGTPLDATLDLRNFKVRGAPVAGKLMQAATLYGIVEALQGPGLLFDRAVLPFRLTNDVMDLHSARAFSASLGLTASGSLNFGAGTIDLDGTVVPAYFFNALPGRIPLIGRLFSPERGSGVFAANYSLRGALSDPSVSLNPLSALAPGVLRSFFDLF